MSSIVRLLNHYAFLLRYHWDYYQSRRRMSRTGTSPKRFPHDYLINDNGESDVKDIVDKLQLMPEDVEGLAIGPIQVFKDKSLVAHESLMGTAAYRGGDVAWCVTERCWVCDTDPSSGSSSQSPRPRSSQTSSMGSDVSGPSPSNVHAANDKMIFRSTHALAKKYNEKATLQCTFIPNPDSPQSLIKFVLICYSTNIASPDYTLLEQNCYYYRAVVIELLVMIVGGEIRYEKDHNMGMNGRFKIVAEDVSEPVGRIKKIYDNVYADFMAARSKQRRPGERRERFANELGISEEAVDDIMDDPDFLDLVRLKAKKRGGDPTTSGPA